MRINLNFKCSLVKTECMAILCSRLIYLEYKHQSGNIPELKQKIPIKTALYCIFFLSLPFLKHKLFPCESVCPSHRNKNSLLRSLPPSLSRVIFRKKTTRNICGEWSERHKRALFFTQSISNFLNFNAHTIYKVEKRERERVRGERKTHNRVMKIC